MATPDANPVESDAVRLGRRIEYANDPLSKPINLADVRSST